MILINLLPDEYRQKSRTPIKFMAATLAAVAVNGSLVAFLAWKALGVAAEVRSELTVLSDTKAGLDPQVAYHKDLENESKLFKSREDTLHKITESRVAWTQRVDQLMDIINDGGDGEKYLVWIDDLNAEIKENTRSASFGTLKATSHSGSNSFAHVANFLDDVEASPLSDVFGKPAPPSGTVTAKDEGYVPSVIANFKLEMDLKAPKERVRE